MAEGVMYRDFMAENSNLVKFVRRNPDSKKLLPALYIAAKMFAGHKRIELKDVEIEDQTMSPNGGRVWFRFKVAEDALKPKSSLILGPNGLPVTTGAY